MPLLEATAVGSQSRAKGRRGEGEVRAVFEGYGFRVQASQRNLGGDQGDCIVIAEPRLLHVECKRRERFNVWEALAQAEAECGELTPVVAFRRNRSPWYAAVRLEMLAELLA
jgi:hypothetical protein